MNKLKMWKDAGTTWQEFESTWDQGSQEAAMKTPIKKLTTLPSMPGMTEETAKHLKWKSLKWILLHDANLKIVRNFLRHPIRYGKSLIRSIIKPRPYLRDEDFFLYGIKDVNEFIQLIDNPNTVLVIGFSYCHKPFECPSGRFTDACIHDPEHPVCRQCFIGKCVNGLSTTKIQTLFIPTIHYVSGKILDLINEHPKKQVAFLITACEMTLEMFGDLGNMANIKGIGVRLDGRICNTMKAFELSERGIKPGLTVILEPTQRRILDLIRHLTRKESQ